MGTARYTAMTETGSLYRLLAWLSPGYPVGAYTYSHGLEQAVESGMVGDAESGGRWIHDVVELGAAFTDTVLLAEAHRSVLLEDSDRLGNVAELAAAFTTTKELALESQAQGRAFFEITEAAWHVPALDMLRATWSGPHAYPVVVGCAAAGHGVELDDAAVGYLHAIAANLVSAAIRLVPLGQTDGQRITAALEQVVGATAHRALDTRLDEMGSATLLVDICSMNHEIQHTRLFRS